MPTLEPKWSRDECKERLLATAEKVDVAAVVALRRDPRYTHPFKTEREAREWCTLSRSERIRQAMADFMRGRR